MVGYFFVAIILLGNKSDVAMFKLKVSGLQLLNRMLMSEK